VIDPSEEPRTPARRRTAAFVIVAMAVTLAWFGWQVYRTSRLSIIAVSKPGDYRLTSPRKDVSKLWVHVNGWIDGQATLEIPGRAPQPVGPGNVEWKIGCDWSQADCILKYAPSSATTGRLEVEYRFD
jgi:hypothetical protein